MQLRLEALEGRWAPAVLTVTTAADSGPGSLRQAILDANSSSGLDTINFSIGSGPQTIALSSPLPPVSDPAVIDATTQPGYAGTPLVTLDGSGAGPTDGLDVTADDGAVRGLTITHFAGSGVTIYSALGTALQTDFLVGNGLDGVTVTGGTHTIGGPGSAIGGCLISGNGRCGVLLLGADNCAIQGNRIGTNAAGTAAMPNALDGISGSGASAGPTASITGNLISGNGRSGVTLYSSDGYDISGNNIGTNADGTAAVPNGGDGVTVVKGGGSSTDITVVIDGDTISGNGRSGVYIGGGGGARVDGCRIGTNAAGEAALGNAADGVTCDGAGGVIISSVLSGNGRVGVLVGGAGSSADIEGDDIGTNAAGTAALGNGIGGVFAYQGAQINLRDLPAVLGNSPVPDVISGNGGNGVTVIGTANQLSSITESRIGTNAAGTAAIPNSDDGIALLDGVTNFTLSFSIISGNAGNGVSLTGSDTTLNLIENQNRIGVAADGSALGNGGNGVLITGGAHDNIVGGRLGPNTGPLGNEIAFNGGAGVDIVSGVGNAVLGNSIHDNSGLGIDLGGNGVTPNDSAGHTGPNHYQNFPVITNVSPGNGGGTDITFTLDSVPSTTFRVEFFANDTPDPSGHGEGQTYLGEADVTTDTSGHFAGTRNVAGTVSAGQEVAATATNPAVGTSTTPYGDTSEFSANFPPPL